jgi:hypothetical protein
MKLFLKKLAKLPEELVHTSIFNYITFFPLGSSGSGTGSTQPREDN